MKLAVVLFAYKRPEILKKALASHTKIDGADYFCFIDHSEMQDKILQIVKASGLYKMIHLRRESNFKKPEEKLNSNITLGITQIFENGYDAVIVLEDDLVIAKDGLQYLADKLKELQYYKTYGSVCLNKGDILNKAFRCWGWGTWKHVWENIEWDIEVFGTYKKGWDKTHSWDYYVAFWMELNQLYARASEFERVKHIGNTGVHYRWYSKFGIRPILRKLGIIK